MTEIKFIAQFFSVLQLIALLTFPVCFYIFKNSKDRGYFVSKVLGLLIFGYLVFLASATRLFPDKRSIDFTAISVIAILSTAVFLKMKNEIYRFLRENLKLLITLEITFLCIFIVFCLIKMGAPDIFSSEKFPDFNIYNRLIDDLSFPPIDSWMWGERINYYYFSHLIFSSLTKIANVNSFYAYNLSLVTVSALCMTVAVSISLNITGKLKTALLSGILIAFAGNLDALQQLIQNGIHKFDWWRSSRVIEGTINEFPFFSFLNGDLHAHFSSLPFFLLIISLLIDIRSIKEKGYLNPFKKIDIYDCTVLIVLGLITGSMIASNPWAVPTALTLVFLFFLKRNPQAEGRFCVDFKEPLTACLVTVLISSIMFLPFILNYSSPSQGLVLLPFNLTGKLSEFFIMFGFPLFFIILYIFFYAAELKYERKDIYAITGALLTAAVYFTFRPSAVSLFLLVFFWATLFLSYKNNFSNPILNLLVLCFGVLFGCELLFLKDNYAPNNARMNTVFKFHFIVFSIFLAITPAIFSRTKTKIKRNYHKIIYTLLFITFFSVSLIYPILGTGKKNKTFARNNERSKFSLNGAEFIEKTFPGTYEAIGWIKENTDRNDVILEATGTPYGYYSIFSTFTGRPTVMGWANHEMVWRPGNYPNIASRVKEIKKIYSAAEKQSIMPLIKKYRIKYIIESRLEKKDYSGRSLKKFADSFQIAFKNKSVTIYKVD